MVIVYLMNFDKFLNNKKFNKIILAKDSYKSNNKLNNIFIKNLQSMYQKRLEWWFLFLKKK